MRVRVWSQVASEGEPALAAAHRSVHEWMDIDEPGEELVDLGPNLPPLALYRPTGGVTMVG